MGDEHKPLHGNKAPVKVLLTRSKPWQADPRDHAQSVGRYLHFDCTSVKEQQPHGGHSFIRSIFDYALFTSTLWFDSMRPIVLNWAKGSSSTYPFRLSTWVLCTKAGVFLVTCLLFLYDWSTGYAAEGKGPKLGLWTRFKLSLLLLIPSFAYVASDLLTFPVLELTSPATFSVLRQSKILITALMCHFGLGRAVSSLQWFAILQLLLSTTLFVADVLEDSMHSNHVTVEKQGKILGLALILFKSFCDAFAVTSQDVLFKKLSNDNFPFPEQQVACAFYMMMVSVGACVYQDGADILHGEGFFDNYNAWAYLAVVHFAIYGVLCMLFLRYLDCMLKMLASTGSIALTIVWDVFFFNAVIGVVKWLAATFVVLSSALYMLSGLRTTTDKEVAAMFVAADQDRDGVLNFQEFRRWYIDPGACVAAHNEDAAPPGASAVDSSAALLPAR